MECLWDLGGMVCRNWSRCCFVVGSCRWVDVVVCLLMRFVVFLMVLVVSCCYSFSIFGWMYELW